MSADGARISFYGNRSSNPASFASGTMERDQNHAIYSMTLAGGDVRSITDLSDWDTYPMPSPDVTQLLWRRVTPTCGKSESGRNSEALRMGQRIAFAFASNQVNPASRLSTSMWPRPMGRTRPVDRIFCTRTVGSSVDIFVIQHSPVELACYELMGW